MKTIDLSESFRIARYGKFIEAAAKIHKGFVKQDQGISPIGNLMSNTFRAEVFRAEHCTKEVVQSRLGRSTSLEVVEAMQLVKGELLFDNDFVQVIKVRTFSGKAETIHGWIVTVCRDHDKHQIDYNHKLSKGKVIYNSYRSQSVQLMNLVHDTFCY
ncbi:hypothetical protein OTK49_21515 [Vibrio coralliirubri]|uniref:hypothetical protein n=1 Tax=Vibrio coralliirubri TaxID=1516159 RepID=UPI0022847145|nr:hypothetical protein [Vibrio coralliirubri]MCY9865101.1 hypothetical protein [Vibrio coralliirubri]